MCLWYYHQPESQFAFHWKQSSKRQRWLSLSWISCYSTLKHVHFPYWYTSKKTENSQDLETLKTPTQQKNGFQLTELPWATCASDFLPPLGLPKNMEPLILYSMYKHSTRIKYKINAINSVCFWCSTLLSEAKAPIWQSVSTLWWGLLWSKGTAWQLPGLSSQHTHLPLYSSTPNICTLRVLN